MKQLEKLMNNQKERTYTIGDLENLSASRLYGFDPSRPSWGGFSISPISQPSFPNLSHQFSYLDSYGKKEKEKPSQNKYDPLNFLSKKSEPLKKSKPLNDILTIRPFTGFQLHIHDKTDGTAHIKYPNGTYTEINSYDAAMADLSADKLGIKKILKKYKLGED